MSRWLLDTVVLSELRKADRADSQVLAWHGNISAQACYVSVITLTEIRVGIRRIENTDPDFAQRLEKWYASQVMAHFQSRLLRVDRAVAEQAADLMAEHGLTPFDALIGATALTHQLTLVTRNTAHFQPAGIPILNPWEYPS